MPINNSMSNRYHSPRKRRDRVKRDKPRQDDLSTRLLAEAGVDDVNHSFGRDWIKVGIMRLSALSPQFAGRFSIFLDSFDEDGFTTMQFLVFLRSIDTCGSSRSFNLVFSRLFERIDLLAEVDRLEVALANNVASQQCTVEYEECCEFEVPRAKVIHVVEYLQPSDGYESSETDICEDDSLAITLNDDEGFHTSCASPLHPQELELFGESERELPPLARDSIDEYGSPWTTVSRKRKKPRRWSKPQAVSLHPPVSSRLRHQHVRKKARIVISSEVKSICRGMSYGAVD